MGKYDPVKTNSKTNENFDKSGTFSALLQIKIYSVKTNEKNY